jgi:hypothetical protein
MIVMLIQHRHKRIDLNLFLFNLIRSELRDFWALLDLSVIRYCRKYEIQCLVGWMSFLPQVNGAKHLFFVGPLEVANLKVESVYCIV